MAITPISGTDTVSFINDPVGNKANALVVIPVNADGSAMSGGSSTSPTVTTFGPSASPIDGVNNANSVVNPLDNTNTARPGIRVFGMVFNGTTWDRMKKPGATARLVSAAASTNATSVKTSAGDIFRITGFNANAAARYLKLYNLAVAPTVGTSTPIWTEYLAPQAKFIIDFPTPLYFGTGISYALTTGSADSDTSALTAGDVLAMNIAYQ